MFECFHCLSRSVIWDADFDTEDYGHEPGGVVHECHCENCGALITYFIFPEDGETENELEQTVL